MLRNITNELEISQQCCSITTSIELVDMPALKIIGSYLRVNYAYALQSINMPELKSVAADTSNSYSYYGGTFDDARVALLARALTRLPPLRSYIRTKYEPR